MAFDSNEARDPVGKWTRLAEAILKTASNLRDVAGVSQEGHDIHTKKAADHLEKAAHQVFAGDNDVAANHLQAALDALKRGHPHHQQLSRIKSHISTQDTLLDIKHPKRGGTEAYEVAARTVAPWEMAAFAAPAANRRDSRPVERRG